MSNTLTLINTLSITLMCTRVRGCSCRRLSLEISNNNFLLVKATSCVYNLTASQSFNYNFCLDVY